MAVFAIFLSVSDSAWAVRDRPHLDTSLGYNVLLSDNDTLLRGVSLSWDGGDPYGSQALVMPTQAQLDALATDYGLNTVHLYLEGDSTTNPNDIGYNKAKCDLLVQRCATADLYLIITIGCNGQNGTMNLSWSQDFWEFYAPLYKDETHVIYEAHNEPVSYTLNHWSNSDWDDQLALYNTIRSHAPGTFILLGSFQGFADDPRYGANYLSTRGVSWDNAGFAHHGYTSLSGIESAISLMKTSTSYPALLCTEFWPGDTIAQNYNSMYESHFNGWMQFQWLGANDWDLLNFKSKIEAAGVVWTPDVATCNWPAKGTPNIPTDGSTIGIFSHSQLLYLTADPANSNDLLAEAEDYTGTGTNAFTIEHTGPRLVSFKAVNGQYVSATSASDSLTASSATAGNTEKFEWLRMINGDVAFRAYGGGGHLAYTNYDTGSVYPAVKKAWYLPVNFATVDVPSGPLDPLPVLTGSPYPGPDPLPIGPSTTVIEAEKFDNGGESLGYHDNDQGNTGGQYRGQDVDIQGCSEGGYNVGWIGIEERLYYTVDVTTAPGDYTLTARVSTQNNGASMQILFNNVYKTNLTVPNTGGWQSWQNTATATITLDSGPQIMTFIRLGVEDPGQNFDFNLNKFTLTYIGGNGDMDLDGDIDMVDFGQFASHWQDTGCGSNDCGGADLTGDGNVFVEDLEAFCDNWLAGL
jgi:hypothetical protein